MKTEEIKKLEKELEEVRDKRKKLDSFILSPMPQTFPSLIKLCGWCGCEIDDDDGLCKKCLDKFEKGEMV